METTTQCPTPTKRGAVCKGSVNETGFCGAHSDPAYIGKKKREKNRVTPYIDKSPTPDKSWNCLAGHPLKDSKGHAVCLIWEHDLAEDRYIPHCSKCEPERAANIYAFED